MAIPIRGPIIIEGAQDNGKSSLVDAMYFAITGQIPYGFTPSDVVRRGHDHAHVSIELAGNSDNVVVVIERSVSCGGEYQSYMNVKNGSGEDVFQEPSLIASKLESLFGIPLMELGKMCFFYGNSGNPVDNIVEALKSDNHPVVQGNDLLRVENILAESQVFDQRLMLVKKTIELGKANDSINKLISERHELQSAVHRNNVNSLVRKLDSLEDKHSGIEKKLTGFREERDALNGRLEMAESLSGELALFDALMIAREGVNNGKDTLEASEERIIALEESKNNTERLRQELHTLQQAQSDMEEATQVAGNAAEIKGQIDHLNEKIMRIEDLTQQVDTLQEARSQIEAEANTFRPWGTGLPESPQLCITTLGEWIRLENDVDEQSKKPDSLLHRALGRIAGNSGSTRKEKLEEILENEGVGIPNSDVEARDLMTRLALLLDPKFDSQANQRAADANLVNIVVKVEGLNEEIRKIEGELDSSQSDLFDEYRTQMDESESLYSRAHTALQSCGIENAESNIDAEILSRMDALERADQARDELPNIRLKKDQAILSIERFSEQEHELSSRLVDVDNKYREWIEDSSEDFDLVRAQLNEKLERYNIPGIRTGLNSLNSALISTERELSRAMESIQAVQSDLRRTLSNDHIPNDKAELRELVDRAVSHQVSEEISRMSNQALRTRLSETKSELSDCEARAKKLEDGLGITRFQADTSLAMTEKNDLEQTLTDRKLAIQIVSGARRRIAARALPRTVEIARQILPEITVSKYFDIRVNSDCDIQIWDEELKDWISVRTLAFAVQKQIELAIHMASSVAFAESNGNSKPAFMVLDDPVPSADPERRVGMLNTVTKLPFSTFFPQLIIMGINGAYDFGSCAIKMPIEKVVCNNSGDKEFTTEMVTVELGGND
tara:strand:+ start:2194 stop:4899 length:2706 start_codon:yes stop_codon:yes gene_type:complete